MACAATVHRRERRYRMPRCPDANRLAVPTSLLELALHRWLLVWRSRSLPLRPLRSLLASPPPSALSRRRIGPPVAAVRASSRLPEGRPRRVGRAPLPVSRSSKHLLLSDPQCVASVPRLVSAPRCRRSAALACLRCQSTLPTRLALTPPRVALRAVHRRHLRVGRRPRRLLVASRRKATAPLVWASEAATTAAAASKPPWKRTRTARRPRRAALPLQWTSSPTRRSPRRVVAGPPRHHRRRRGQSYLR